MDIANNGTVIFRENTDYSLTFEATASDHRLSLSARPGGSIEFYDSVYISKADEANDFQVSYNQLFEDEEGEHAQAGDIVFAGQNSEVLAMGNLYDGRLVIKDGAVYEGQGISVHSSASGESTPTLLLQNGTLDNQGYDTTLESDTELAFIGVNAMTASSLNISDGGSLSFTLDESHGETAALTLTGSLTLGGSLSVHLDKEGAVPPQGNYKLITLTDGAMPTSTEWTSDSVTVNGLDGWEVGFDNLQWENGTLYLYLTYSFTWTNGTGNGVWDTSSANWLNGSSEKAYLNGAQVIFGDDASGAVTLEGELTPSEVIVNNSAGHDYIFDGEGSLSGSMNLVKSGEGKLTINTENTYTGGTEIKSGTLKVQTAAALGSGAVALSGGTLEVATDGFNNGLTSSGDSRLVIVDGCTLNLQQAIGNSGTLSISGALDVSRLTPAIEEACLIGLDGQKASSGFAKDAVYSVTVVHGGGVTDNGARVFYKDLEMQLGADGVASGSYGGIDYGHFELHEPDAATSSSIHAVAGAANATVSMNGGTLTVDDVTSVDATGGAIVLDGGTLAGDGTIQDTAVSSQGGTIDALLTGNTSLEILGGDTSLNRADNSYTGGTEIKGGSLVVGADDALGSGLVDLQGGTLDLGGHRVDNEIQIWGGSSLVGADNFTGDLKLTGSGTVHVEDYNHMLSGGKVFETSADGAVYEGAITLSGGTIRLKGAPLVVQGPVTFVPGTTTTIDVSLWPEEVPLENGSLLASFADNTSYEEGCLTLSGLENAKLFFHEDTGALTLVLVAPVDKSQLSGNQSGVYDALEQIAADGTVSGELGNLAERVLGAGSSAEAAALLDRVNGASLATAMNSQLEGNLAHLRRLRQNIGSGQLLTSHVPAGQASVASAQDGKAPLAAPTYLPKRMSAYVNAYNSDHTLSADGSGSGMRRTEWGGVLGMEGQISESLTLGASLSAGRAKVEPTNDARYHEETAHVDLYAVAGSGKGWQSVTSVGVGFHSFDFRRHYLDGRMATADGVDGFSFNAMEEVNYTFEVSEQSLLQPFFAVQTSVNRIDSFSESGAGNASLQGESRDAWATDLTLGARYLRRFSAISHAQEATLSLQAGVTASVGDVTADLPLRFQGAVEEAAFIARSARSNRWGCNMEASLSLPVTEDMAVFAAGGAILRGDSSEANAQLGVRISF